MRGRRPASSDEYLKLVNGHAETLGFTAFVPTPHPSWTTSMSDILWFRHEASGCVVNLPGTPPTATYVRGAKAKLSAALNRATGVPPRKRLTPVAPDEPLDIFWARTLLRMVIRRTAKPTPDVATPGGETFDDELSVLRSNLACAACGNDVPSASSVIYCADSCQQSGALVRYARKAAREGRGEEDADFVLGVGLLLVGLFKGGYPARARALKQREREAVFERDGWICTLCGKPAEQVDHIRGSSRDPANLRATCAPCNRGLALSMERKATRRELADFLELAHGICMDLAGRIAAPMPSRCCDDHERWRAAQTGLKAARRRKLLGTTIDRKVRRTLVSGMEERDASEGDFEDVDGRLYDAMQKDD